MPGEGTGPDFNPIIEFSTVTSPSNTPSDQTGASMPSSQAHTQTYLAQTPGDSGDSQSTSTSAQNSLAEALGPDPLDIDLAQINIPELLRTQQYILELKSATLKQSSMDAENIWRLQNPISHHFADTSDKDFIYALETFISCMNAPQKTYDSFRAASKRRHPEDPFLSFDQMKHQIETLTGVSAIYHGMCIGSCVGYTGPQKDLENCPVCTEPRYQPGSKRPCKQFATIPIGPVIQALYGSPEVSKQMHYLEKELAKNLEHSMLQPLNYTIQSCNHADVTLEDLKSFRSNTAKDYREKLHLLLTARNKTHYEELRLLTGLTKQTIFSGLSRTLGVPHIFVRDIMHLVNLNDPDLLLGLWQKTLKCYPPDNHDNWDWGVLKSPTIWKAHGETIEQAVPFIPSTFGRAPRNPAEKINSGYKAWEFQLYIFGLGPTLLRHILPRQYWLNYCKLVSGVCILQQHSISHVDLKRGSKLLNNFCIEFENLYYQRQVSRLHFVRHSIHLLTHMGSETVRAGPLACYAQWPMETAIGNLGAEIQNDRDFYANLIQRGILRTQ
ncbi:hypothetical protein C0991_012488, partial [Blastosporella zonata]